MKSFGALGPHCDPATPLQPAPFTLPPGTDVDVTLLPGGFGFAGALVRGVLVLSHGGAGPPIDGAPTTDAPITTGAAGVDSIVVVDADGRVFGAGWNCDGQATGALSPPPFAPWTRVPLPVTIRSVAVGQRHALALDAGGTVWAWGGATGGGRPAAVLGPATSHPSSSVVTAIAAGGRHSLAATHAPYAVLAWGDNLRGQCGAAACGEVATPTPIPTLAGVGVVALGAGAAHSVAVTAAGQALAWGAGVALGREGATDDAPRDDCTPSAVDGGGLADVDLVSVSTGAHHTVAVDSCGGAWVWGAVGGGRDVAGAPPRRIAHGATAAVAGWWHGLVVMRAEGSVVE